MRVKARVEIYSTFSTFNSRVAIILKLIRATNIRFLSTTIFLKEESYKRKLINDILILY